MFYKYFNIKIFHDLVKVIFYFDACRIYWIKHVLVFVWLAGVLRRSLKLKLFDTTYDLLQFLICFGLIGHLTGELWPLVMVEIWGNSCLGNTQMPILFRIGKKLSSAVPEAVLLQWSGEPSRLDDVQLNCFWICADGNTVPLEYGIWGVHVFVHMSQI